jgi:hypothetical protein
VGVERLTPGVTASGSSLFSTCANFLSFLFVGGSPTPDDLRTGFGRHESFMYALL